MKEQYIKEHSKISSVIVRVCLFLVLSVTYLEVNAQGTPTITSFTPTSGCSGSLPLVTITGTNLTGTTSVKFNGTAAASFTNVNSTTVTATPASGTTTGTISLTTAGGTATSSQTFTVNNPGIITPYLDFNNVGWQSTTSAPMCQGGFIEFGSQSSAQGTSGTWTISGPNGFYSYARDTMLNDLQPINSGTYIQTYYNPNGCSVSKSFAVTVNAYPVPNVNSPSICYGTTATLTANGGGTYSWSTGGTSDTINTSTAGTYTVTVTSAAGCSATGSGTVTISNPNASIVVTSGCGSGGTQSTLTTSGGGSYLWSTGATTAGITSAAVATYSVTVTSPAGCTATGSATSSFYSTSPTVGLSSNSPVCMGSTIDITATPSGSTSYTYSWSGPASYASTTQNPVIANALSADSGIYTVSVTDNHGCVVIGSISVNVDPNCMDSTTIGINGAGSSYAPCTQILRFDHYNGVVAATSGGQNCTWILQNGNILTMNITCTAGAISAVAAPSWSGSAFGETGYTGLSGKTVLYTNGAGYSKLVFSNIKLKDSLGHQINNFTLIGIDGESTDNSERDTIISNGTSWYDYDTINPPPSEGNIPTETGIGTNELVWKGNGPANARARLVSTNNPTNFTVSMVAAGLQGFAMGLSNPIQAPDSLTICSGGTFNATPSNVPGGTTYTWSAPTISPPGSITGGIAQTNASSASQTLVNTTTSPATAVYNIIPSNNCSGLGYTVTVTVEGSFSASVIPSTPQCASTNIIVSALPNTTGTYSYQWSGPSSFSATGDSFTITNATLANGGTYNITMTSSNSCTATASGTLTVVRCLSVSGAVFDDANGNGIIDGADASTNLGQTLYSVLSDTTGNVVAVSSIASNGTFTMGKMLPNTSGFHVYVSTSSPSIGSSAVGYYWPANWVSTLGQYGNNNHAGTGVYYNTGELIPITTDTSNITGMMIGFDRLPISVPQTYTISTPHVNDQKPLVDDAGLGMLSGSDPEDGAYGFGSTFVINSLEGMNGNSLYYDANGNGILESGELIAGYTTITNYNPEMLYVKFTGANTKSMVFNYLAKDAASKSNPTPYNYGIQWGQALPVRLLYFNAEKVLGSQSLLTWATASEQGNAYFDIERSGDAQNWNKIGQQKGAGTTISQSNYSMTDVEPMPDVNYYRLKQVDMNGVAEYSEIASVTFDGEVSASSLSVSVYPNPLGQTGGLNISLNSPSENISSVEIINTIGQVVFDTKLPPIKNYQIMGLNLPTGVYLVSVHTQTNSILTSRLVISD